MADALSPFVYWGQTSKYISLKIELRNTKDIEVTLTEETLAFKANGEGQKGSNQYSVQLRFYLDVEPETSQYRPTDTCVEFKLAKKAPEIWPRLTEERVKLPWLKIDFDKFMAEGESEDDANNQQEYSKDIIDKITNELRQPGSNTGNEGGFNLNYLVIYNLLQFVGFSYIFSVLLFSLATKGIEAKMTAVEAIGTQLVVCQLAAFLEIVHPLLGLVKTGILAPLAQVLGRNFILFVLILSEPRLHDRPVVFYLFLVWAAIEVVRYPYYLLQSAGRDVAIITWLRYTAWIPLYPFGMLLEGTLVFMAIPLFQQTGFYNLILPNAANFAFYFPYLLSAYPLVLAGAGYQLMHHMYQQRLKKLGPSLFSLSQLTKKTS